MADLIDRADAVKLLRGEAVGKYPQSFYFGLFAAADELKKLPAVAVVEVKHGHWKSMKAYPTEFVCSDCGCLWPDIKTPYCPHCGAEMD